MKTFISFAAGAAAGAAAAHFLDPQSGRRRRAAARDQAISKAKQGASAAQTQAQQAAGKVQGAAASAKPSSTPDHDDMTLAHKVETEIFRDPAAPKGDVSVDVQAGVAYLRGEVSDASWIERLGEGARQVEGVQGVKNLLHTTGTPAPVAEPRGAATERFGS
ncbi:MAG TPA: BON domain-containing protein [Solirubrobacteraceae bacterium]|jgi:osmotically-inducible protein OsmY